MPGVYPYVWLDAKIERVREPGGVRHKALVIAYGVGENGQREVLGMDVGEAETEAFWTEFLYSLKDRGLSGVQLVISDADQGLKNAIASVIGARWQRCTVHVLRDMLGHVARAQQPLVGTAIRYVFNAADGDEARERLGEIASRLADTAPKVRRCWKPPRKTCAGSTSSPPDTGRDCGRRTRWSDRAAKSAAAQTLWASTRTTPHSSAWPTWCCSNNTRNGK
ncbi:MAG: transposase, partial [Patulibacter sp.]